MLFWSIGYMKLVFQCYVIFTSIINYVGHIEVRESILF